MHCGVPQGLPRLDSTLGFLSKASPLWEVRGSPLAATQVKTNLSSSSKFRILHKISAVISEQLAGAGQVLSRLDLLGAGSLWWPEGQLHPLLGPSSAAHTHSFGEPATCLALFGVLVPWL